MRKIIAALSIAALGALGGLACSATSETEPTTTSAASTSFTDSPSARYLATLDSRGISHPMGDSYLVLIGTDVVCATLDETANPTSGSALGVAMGIADEFDSDQDAAFATGAAIGAFCPEYQGLLK